MVMTLGDRIRKSGELKGILIGEAIGEKKGELRGELNAFRKLQMEGLLTREQYHAKAEPIQAKLNALLAETDAEKEKP